jgi:chorismate lyase/3-hydroxybenzoate synthase
VTCNPAARPAPQVSYRQAEPGAVLAEPGTLAVFGFGAGASSSADPRWLGVALESFDASASLEIWQVDGPITQGRAGDVRWSAGGGWLFAAIELDERTHGGPRDTGAAAYAQLCGFLATRSERHVQRLWNYLGDINQGDGDSERYKQFCDGRVAGMNGFFAEGFPAATAIGHHVAEPRLQVYLPGATHASTAARHPVSPVPWRCRRKTHWQFPALLP